MKRVVVAVALAACAALVPFAGCSTKTHPTAGLMIVMGTDGVLVPDRLHVGVTSADGTKTYRKADYVIPSETTFPTTLAIASNGDPTESIGLDVSVYLGVNPLDVREHQVYEIPNDHVAELDIVFASICSRYATLSNGVAVSTCPTGETCDPGTGDCVSDVVNAGSLPTYGGDAGDIASVPIKSPGPDGAVPEGGGPGVADGCAPGSTACYGSQPQSCSGGVWVDSGAPCTEALGFCVASAGHCAAAPPSCSSDAGKVACGDAGESCCKSPTLSGATFNRSYTSDEAGVAVEAGDNATVSSVRIDKYEVTVARFRAFVRAVTGAGWKPADMSGKHYHVHAGAGLEDPTAPVPLPGLTESEYGWDAANWNGYLTTSASTWTTNLTTACDATGKYATWVGASGNDTLPINCVTWYEALAFCIWDGGFLPSEAEWESVAAAGAQQREYPWGPTDPGDAATYAVHACEYPSGSGKCTGFANIAPVGSAPSGAAPSGHLDVAGNLSEWVFDWYNPVLYVNPCSDCASLQSQASRGLRGGSYQDGPAALQASARMGDSPTKRSPAYGVRCARTP